MSPRGYTEVRLEELVPQVVKEKPPVPQAEETLANPPPAAGGGKTPPPPASTPPGPGEPPVRTEYLPPAPVFLSQPPYPPACQNCIPPFLALVFLILLILAVLLLTAIFVLLLSLHRFSCRFRQYSLWVRRHFAHSKKDRYWLW
jgi:hypothetical protein